MNADVVIVDDEPGTLKLLKTLLEIDGHDVRAFTSGAPALRSIRMKAPDLIMLDIRMPGLNGLDLCEKLKADPGSAGIPLVFVTAAIDIEDKIAAFAAGGVDYITKPFDKAEVLARVRTHLSLFHAQREVARYRQLIETSNVGTAMTNVDGTVAVINQAMCDLSGFDTEAALRMTWMEPIPEPHLRALRNAVDELLAGRIDGYRGEHIFIRADGIPRWAEISVSCIRKPNHQPEYIVFQAVDITPKVTAREELERARNLLAASADSMLDPQILMEAVRDPEGRVVDFRYLSVNRATCNYLQVEAADLIGGSALGDLPNLEGSGLLGRYARCLEDGQPVVLNDFSYFNEMLDDARRYDIRATRAGADLVSLSWSDVTDRYQAARRLAHSEEQYRLLAENAGDVVSHVRHDRFAWISPSVEGVLGAPPEYWIGRGVSELLIPGDLAAHQARWKTLSGGGSVQQRVQVRSADGVTHWVHLHAKPFYDADGQQDGVTAAFRLIDAEVAAEHAAAEVRREKARADTLYRRSMDSSAVGMCLVAPDGAFVDVNPALCEYFGYDAATLKSKTWQELTAEEYLQADLDNVAGVLAGRIESYRMVKQYIHAAGHPIWGDLSVGCVRDEDGHVEILIAQVNDITAEVRAREELINSEQRNRVLAQGLQSELNNAAHYLKSSLPAGLAGPVSASSRYLPSRTVGGDCFDFAWADDDHLIVYLLDVSGHGVQSALIAVSIRNMLRYTAMPNRDLLRPDELLAALNEQFRMDRHDFNYFTIFYGVYQRSTGTLHYSGAGHPPALLVSGGEITQLHSQSLPVGMFDDAGFSTTAVTVPPGSQLLLYSDGAYEFPLDDGGQWTREGFVEAFARQARTPDWSLDQLLDSLRRHSATDSFEDDCSLVRLDFN